MAHQSHLLTLPAELRLMIWSYAVEAKRIHVLSNGVASCQTSQRDMCEGPSQCHRHPACRDERCPRCPPVQWPSWHHCCRRIYRETQVFRDSRTIVSFISSHILLQIMRKSPERLSLLYQVHVHLGPAKFGQRKDLMAAQQALDMLASAAVNLDRLELTVGFYYQACTDRLMLDSRILQVLVLFRNLKALRLEMGQPPPGPTGGIHGPKTTESLLHRLNLLEFVLSNYLCQQRGLESKTEAAAVMAQKVKREVLALIEP